MLNIGIYGGSFDPVHSGHVNLVRECLEKTLLDMVYIVPNYIQPFKENKIEVSTEDRINMLEIAFKDVDRSYISHVEINRKGISYTYKTLDYFKEKHRGEEIYFISGSDAFVNIHKYKKGDYILANFSQIIALRSEDEKKRLNTAINETKEKYGTKVILIDNKIVDAASSDIKENLKIHNKVLPLPEGVHKYIKERGLYRD